MTVNFLSEKDSKDNKPLVTVGVICYNTGLYVTEALDSILEQTYKNYEVIILDDCSPDKNSVQIIEDYLNAKSLNFKFIKRNTNQGLAKNFLQIAALANPQSDYFCCIGDDIWHPNFLEESIRILEKSSESVIACFSDSKTLKYSTKEVIKNSIFKDESISNSVYQNLLNDKKEEYYLLENKKLFEALIIGNFINAISVVYKLKQYREAGGHVTNYDIEDYPTWVNWAKKGFEFIYINKELSTYNIHGNNYSIKYSSKVYNSALQIQISNLKYTSSSQALLSTYFKLLKDNKSTLSKMIAWLTIVREKPIAFIRLPYLLVIQKRSSNSAK